MVATVSAFRFGLVSFAACFAGCVEIPLEPEVPALRADRSIPYEACELFVVIRDKKGETGPKDKWVVFVDGEARAVLPAGPGYTRIFLPPGIHAVVAALRGSEFIPPIPAPFRFEKQVKTSVSCGAGGRYGVAVNVKPPTTWRGLRMSTQPLPEDQLEHATEGLTFTQADH